MFDITIYNYIHEQVTLIRLLIHEIKYWSSSNTL